jgi:hypothetical protein
MDWTKVKAGDPIEPILIGHRVWRYRLGPPLVLLSFCLGSSEPWPADQPLEADKEPNLDAEQMAHGVHAFKTLEDLRTYFGDLGQYLRYRNIYSSPHDPAYFDGVVRGTVQMWGICIDGPLGCRAQYVRPTNFDEACGDQADIALDRLRRMFGMAQLNS